MSGIDTPEVFQPKTWEQFKEEMDYLLQILKQDGVTEETKKEVNGAMQRIVFDWSNPKWIIPAGTVLRY